MPPFEEGLTIKQAASLYNTTIDALYYYEKIGIIDPGRNPANGYRMYTDSEFAKLNIVEAMLNMDFTLAQIRSYLSKHSLDTTISLLRAELDKLNDISERLRDRQKGVESALVRYTQALLEAPMERIKELELPARPVLMLGKSPDKDTDLPRIAAARCNEMGIPVNIFHAQPLFTITTEMNDRGTFDGKAAYLYSEGGLGVEDGELPAGRYLTVTFRGSAQRTPELYRGLKDHMDSHGLVRIGDPLEFWTVNEYISDDASEYIHTLQVRVEDGEERH